MYVVKRKLDGCADSAQDVRSKNWRELVPSLSGLVHGVGILPSTSVPGFQVPPLRGWVMVPERLRCDSSAASRLGDGSIAHEMRCVLYGCVGRWAISPVPLAWHVKVLDE